MEKRVESAELSKVERVSLKVNDILELHPEVDDWEITGDKQDRESRGVKITLQRGEFVHISQSRPIDSIDKVQNTVQYMPYNWSSYPRNYYASWKSTDSPLAEGKLRFPFDVERVLDRALNQEIPGLSDEQ